MRKWIVIVITLFSALQVRAQAPEMFRYQGRLVDGTNLVNASLPMSFKLYDALSVGHLLYEDSNTVQVVDGLYATYIGDDTVYGSLSIAMTNASVYLELVVNGTTLSPRERLVSVPYALNAGVPTIPSGTIAYSEVYPNSKLESQGYSPVPTSGDGPGKTVTESQFNGEVFVLSDQLLSVDIGGSDNNQNHYTGIIYHSFDVTNWVSVTTNAPCAGRIGCSFVIFDNKLWMMGGANQDRSSGFNDVWWSADGSNWNLAVEDAGWSARSGPRTIVFDNKLWVMGGRDPTNVYSPTLNDVWCSDDGSNWTQVLPNTPFEQDWLWGNRGTIVFQNKLWVYDQGISGKRDLWWTTNGVDWVIQSQVWTPDLLSTPGVIEDKLVSGYYTSTNFLDWSKGEYSFWTGGQFNYKGKTYFLMGNIISSMAPSQMDGWGKYYIYRKD